MTTVDALRKPDMPAVIARTHISSDIHGFLLPVFEAISNAIHGVEQRFSDQSMMAGHVDITFTGIGNSLEFSVSVTDNGSGLDDQNYISFLTPFSGLKLSQKGRGFGRFIAFKVFNRILYSSRYNVGTARISRAFRFNIYDDRELIYFDAEPDFSDLGVRVEYDELKPEWHSIVESLSATIVADEIAHHFFPEFIRGTLPRINLTFGDAEIELTSRFSSLFVSHGSGSVVVKIDGADEELQYSLSRVPRSRRFDQNALLFSAGGRIVGSPRDLSQKLGRSFFVGEADEKYIIIAVISGDALEQRLNDSRTSIGVAPKAIEDIVSAVAKMIEEVEGDQIRVIKEAQRKDLSGALSENPILRTGLSGQSLEEYVRSKPNSWGADQFVSDLALRRFRASNNLSQSIATASVDRESYYDQIKDLVAKIDLGKKDALAEYVVHRKKIITLIEAARKFDTSGKISPEDTIHDLVFRRYSDNATRGYFDHNLWLVDDALAFCPYISSDRTIHGGRRQKGDKVTDLMFYEDSIVLGENDGSSLVIVEFKKPVRDDYVFGPAKSDPVMQVVETLEKAIANGGITRSDGGHFSFVQVTRRFAYIIADLTPSLIRVLQRHDFKNDWNPKVWIRYRDTEQMAIYVYGYDTMIEGAKKRNAAFFSVLLDE
jgi:hypothetical protein